MGYLDNNAKAPEFLSQMILKVFTTTTWNSATIAGHSIGQKQFIIRFIHGDIIESRPSKPFAALEQNFLWNQSSNRSTAIYIHTLQYMHGSLIDGTRYLKTTTFCLIAHPCTSRYRSPLMWVLQLRLLTLLWSRWPWLDPMLLYCCCCCVP